MKQDINMITEQTTQMLKQYEEEHEQIKALKQKILILDNENEGMREEIVKDRYQYSDNLVRLKYKEI